MSVHLISVPQHRAHNRFCVHPNTVGKIVFLGSLEIPSLQANFLRKKCIRQALSIRAYCAAGHDATNMQVVQQADLCVQVVHVHMQVDKSQQVHSYARADK